MTDEDPGFRDPDQPTKSATNAWLAAMVGEFTEHERLVIRMKLGLAPAVPGGEK